MANQPLRLVFAGTPDFAARHLEALLAHKSEFNIVGVFTQPDRKSGRGKKLQASPVKTLALSHQLPVFQPLSLNDPEVQAKLADIMPDAMIVVAYGLLLPAVVLNLPKFGCLNVHASLLPRWRGAAPIERALLAGDSETGVCIMQMDEGLDTGPVLARQTVPIKHEDNAGSLGDTLASVGCTTLIATLHQLTQGEAVATPQSDTGITYASKLSREEAAIDWSEPAEVIRHQIQAFFPRSPAYTKMNDERIMLLAADSADSSCADQTPGTIIRADRKAIVVACGKGELSVSQVQIAGKKPMSVADLLNGRRDAYAPGKRFTLAAGAP